MDVYSTPLQGDPELDTLRRIVDAIKAYHQQTGDHHNPAISETMATYLKKHLSTEDWGAWLCLRFSKPIDQFIPKFGLS